MTLNEYISINGLPDMKKLGKINKITYYIEKNIPDNEDLGIPIIVQEKEGDFSICTSNQSLYAINIFGGET